MAFEKHIQELEQRRAKALSMGGPKKLDERKAQFDAAMRVHGLFERMADLSDRIVGLREQAKAKAAALPDGDRTKVKLATLVNRIEDVRRQIVATKEGGAITGEERLREHTDTLYSAILGFDGLPAATLVTRIGVLEGELDAITAKFDALSAKALPALNGELQKRKLPELSWPPKGPMPPMAELRSSDGNVGGMSSPKKYYRHPLASLKMY